MDSRPKFNSPRPEIFKAENQSRSRLKRGVRKAVSMLGATALLGSSLVIATGVIEAVVPAAPAHAAEPLVCDGSMIYLQRGEEVDSLDLSTNPVTRTEGIITGLQNNGLGVTNGGEVVYSIQNQDGSSAKEIIYHVLDTGYTGSAIVNPGARYFVRGGVNPVNDIYYFANSPLAGDTVKVGAYRAPTADHSEIAPQLVAEISGIPSGNGDMAFSASGDLLIVADNLIFTIEGELPSPPQSTPVLLEAKLVKELEEGTEGNGIAFANNGNFYVSTSGSVIEVNPASGDVIRTFPYPGAGFGDLASCAYPNTISLKKNLENERYNSGDQFTVTISGQDYLGQDTGSISATTTGSESGVQTETAGPEFVFQGNSFTISEAAAGTTNLNSYNTALQCHEAVTNTNVPVTADGSGGWTIDYPSGLLRGADVVCTINNEAHEPSIELTKTTDLTDYVVGELVTFEFTAQNTGNVPLIGVEITDSLPGLSELTNFVWPGAPNELQPGEAVTAEATLTVTQAHIDAGSVTNNANVVGTPPFGDDVTDTDEVTVPFTPTPEIELVKTTDLSEPYVVGDTVTYDFVATNTGNVTLEGVTITDSLPGLSELDFNWDDATDEGVLAPGDSVSATATLTVTQAHMNNGAIENTANAVGTPPTGPEVSDTSTVEVPLDSDPSISLIKSTTPTEGYDLNDTVNYTFVAENTGNVTLSGVEITDLLPGLSSLSYDWDEVTTEGALEPGETVSATATLTVTQEHLDQQWIHNTATVAGTPPAGDDVTDTDSVTVTTEFNPDIELTKTGSLNGSAAAGQTVTFEFVATNTGNVTLTDVVIADEMLAGAGTEVVLDWSEATAEGVLAPGEQVFGSASYVLTQSDVDAGSVVNLGEVVGTPPALTDPEDPDAPAVPSEPVRDSDPEAVPLLQEPGLSLVKNGELVDTGEAATIGDTIEFEFIARNIGNTTLTNVVISDPLPGLSELTYDWTDATAEGTLLPGEVVTATASYVLTQADIDAGHVANVGSVTGTPPTVDPEDPPSPLPPVEDDVIVPVPPAPGIELEKSSALVGDAVAGDEVEFTFVAENTGNTTLTGVTITDPLPGLSDLTYDWSAAAGDGVLEPGETVRATATLVLTQDHIDNGWVQNTATATGTPPNEFDPQDPEGPGIPADPVTDDSTVITELPADPSIELEKSSELAGDVAVGEEVEFTFVAENTGNVTLTGVTITDPLPGLSDLTYDWADAAGEGVLEPGDTVRATATLVLTQELVDQGWVQNSATATGTPPDVIDPENPGEPGEPADPVTDDSTVITELPAEAAIELVKTGLLDAQAAADETVTFSFTATNTGNVTLTEVVITDEMLAGAGTEVVLDWGQATAEGVLAPGEQVFGTASYVLTQADVDAGSVVNLGEVVGTPPALTDPEDPDAPAVPSEPVEDEDPATVPLPQDSALQFVKTGGLEGTGEYSAPGDIIEYEFVATNIGNTTLTDVVITDPLPGLSALVYSWPNATAEGTLLPGEVVTATATYVLTQADIDAGHVANTGSVTGTPPTIDPEDPTSPLPPVEDDVIVPVPPVPSIALEKTSALIGDAVAGNEVEFTFVAENTGNVTLTDVEITDPLPDLSELTYDWSAVETAGTLLPGEQVSATATYVLTQADIDAGFVANTATAEGTPPNVFDPQDPEGPGIPADPVTDDSTVITELPADPSIELEKTSELAGDVAVGEEVEFTFVAENTGNVTLTDVTITDPLPGLSDLTYDWADAAGEGVLEPGDTVRATATLVLTQELVDQGWVLNTANVEGTPPDVIDPENPGEPGEPADPVTDDSTVITDLPFDPSINLVKLGALDGQADAGETITFDFVATNTGNVTLTEVVISDEMLAGADADIVLDWGQATAEGVLAPGEQVFGTASYVLTQADVDAGSVVNLGEVVGTPPALTDPEDPDAPAVPSEPVEDEDPATVPLLQEPALELVKNGELTSTGEPATVGDVIEYEFIATNVGNVTISNVEITDPLPGLSDLTYDWSNAAGVGVLEPGNRVTATATYQLTQADIDAGHVANVGSVTGTPPTVDPEDPPAPLPPVEDDVIVPVPPAPAIELEKSSALAGDVAVGETVEFMFVAENTGNTTLTGVMITDPLPGLSELVYDWSSASGVGVLEPGDTVTATATLVLTQELVDQGWVLNTATVAGTPPDLFDPENPDEPGEPADPITDDSTVITELPFDPSINLVKLGTLDTQVAAGETISFDFVATNTGNVTLTDVVIADEMLANADADIVLDWGQATAEGVLAPGEQVFGSASYVLTQADVDAGAVVNLGEVVGTPPALTDPEDPDAPAVPSEPVRDEDPETVPLPQEPTVQLVKQSELIDTGADSVPGDVIEYTFIATNIGNTTLTDVEIADPLPGLSELTYDWSAAVSQGVLLPGESVTATATLVLTQEHIDLGSVLNTGTATGTPPDVIDPENPDEPGEPADPVTDDSTVITDIPVTPAIELEKSSVLAGDVAVGETVEFAFVATNTGNVTLDGVTISDPLPGLSELTFDWTAATAEGILAPGEQVFATATLVLTQDHVDNGWVLNTATAEGTPPDVIDPENPDEPGEPSEPITDDSTVITELPSAPAIELEKSSTLAGEVAIGETVEFGFIATNTGNTTLTGVRITDPLPGLSELVYDWSDAAGAGVLEPGDTVTATAILVLTQELVDQGWVLNTATAEGTPPEVTDPENPDEPGEPSEPITDDSTVITELPAEASIELVKTGLLDAQAAAGESITYTFVATNTGNVTIDDVIITDPKPGLSELVFDWSEALAEGVLAPGEQVSATATYVLTQGDVDSGVVENLATARGTPPALTDPEDPEAPAVPADPVTDEDPESVLLPQEPALQMVKTGGLVPTEEPATAGDVIEFEFIATNIGNATLTDVSITDPLPGLSELTYNWSDATSDGVLAPGERVTASATYVLTQADVDAGYVVNSGSVTGTPPTTDPDDPGQPLPPVEDEVIVPVPPAPSIVLEKTSEIAGDVESGEIVEFAFAATNTGNTTLTDVIITDPMTGLSELVYDWSAATAEGVLAPGEQVFATATLELTQELVDQGWVRNTATATGTPPDVTDPQDPDAPAVPSDPITDDSTVITDLPALPAIEIFKSSEVSGSATVGDTITYTFQAQNTGNVTLTDIKITDPMPGLSAITYNWSNANHDGVLDPGEWVSATASYTLTEADVRAGKVVNTAVITGTPPPVTDPLDPDAPSVPGVPVTDEDTVTTQTGELPSTGASQNLWKLIATTSALLLAGGVLMIRNRRQLSS